jgi:hypothetical protein
MDKQKWPAVGQVRWHRFKHGLGAWFRVIDGCFVRDFQLTTNGRHNKNLNAIKT